MNNAKKFLAIFHLALLIGCTSTSNEPKLESHRPETEPVFTAALDSLHGINVFFVMPSFFLMSKKVDKALLRDSIATTLRKLGCTVYLDQAEIEKQPKSKRYDLGVLYLSLSSVLAQYSEVDASGHSAEYVPIVQVDLSVALTVQALFNKANIIAPVWRDERFFYEPADDSQMNTQASKAVDRLLAEFVTKYREVNPNTFPIVYVQDI